jgi:acetyl esterase/lipase
MDGLAVDLARHGFASWNLEYRRIGNGGGWPATFEDVAAGIDALADVETRLDLDRAGVVGHSAGGQLALWAAARPSLHPGRAPDASRVRLRSIVALAPVSDLADAHRRGLSSSAVEELLRRSPSGGAERFAAASPAELLPLGVTQVVIHGTDDESVPVEMSRRFVARAQAAGDDVVYHELAGTGHMELIDAGSEAWALTLPALSRM